MPTVTETIKEMRDDILARLPEPKAADPSGDPQPTPPPANPDPEPKAADLDELTQKVATLEAEVTDLKARVAALEEAASAPAAKTEPPAAEPGKEEPAALKQLLAILKNPIVVQALAAGEKRDRQSAPAAEGPNPDIVAQYLALTPGSAEAAAFYRDHAAEIAAAMR